MNKIDNDKFHEKNNNTNILFNLIKNNKDIDFINYITKFPKDDIDVNIKDSNGNYLLSIAIIKNFIKIIEILLEYDAKTDIIDAEGHSILYYPIKYNYQEALELLINHDNKSFGLSLVNIEDTRKSVPLFYAIKYKNFQALKFLINNELLMDSF